MFLKLTDMDYNDDGTDLSEEKDIFMESSKIVFMRRYNWHGKRDCTELYIGTNAWTKVKETPEEIIEMIGQYK